MNESTKKLGEVTRNSISEDENIQTPALTNAIGTPLLPDTLTLMK